MPKMFPSDDVIMYPDIDALVVNFHISNTMEIP